MAMLDYICPVCNRAVLGTTELDDNAIQILFNHLITWHEEELNKPKETE